MRLLFFLVRLAAFNPFRPDVPPSSIDVFPSFRSRERDISVSQGALHAGRYDPQYRSVVWRLEEDRKSWTKQCEGFLKLSSRNGNFKRPFSFLPSLHPHDPETIFFHYPDDSGWRAFTALWSLDLRTGEQEEFAQVRKRPHRITVFQPMVSCLPTPIPRYEELRGMYDGSYRFWVQGSSSTTTTTTPASITGNHFC